MGLLPVPHPIVIRKYQVRKSYLMLSLESSLMLIIRYAAERFHVAVVFHLHLGRDLPAEPGKSHFLAFLMSPYVFKYPA